jgi:RimJ/RimL family protein N-acetyltransferase
VARRDWPDGVRGILMSSYTFTEALTDGTVVTIRPITKGDGGGLLAAFDNLDPNSIYTRFFGFKSSLTDADLRNLTEFDLEKVVALIVTAGEQLVAGGRYVLQPDHKVAELAFVTAESYRGKGIAALVLKHLIEIARQRNVSKFEADVLALNAAMLSVFRRCGMPVKMRTEGNVVHVEIDLQSNVKATEPSVPDARPSN